MVPLVGSGQGDLNFEKKGGKIKRFHHIMDRNLNSPEDKLSHSLYGLGPRGVLSNDVLTWKGFTIL